MNPAGPTSLGPEVSTQFSAWKKLDQIQTAPTTLQSLFFLLTTFRHHQLITKPQTTVTMSFLGFGRPQPTSAEKIAAVEAEMKLIIDMQNRYDPLSLSYTPAKSKPLPPNFLQ